MQQTGKTSAKVFFRAAVMFCALVFLLVTLNVFIRSTEGKGVKPWESFQESAGTQQEGLSIMRSYGCFLCHRIDDFGGEIGPKLNGVKERKSRQELFDWIRSPKSIKPNTIMPQFNLSEDEILKIISYLETK